MDIKLVIKLDSSERYRLFEGDSIKINKEISEGNISIVIMPKE